MTPHSEQMAARCAATLLGKRAHATPVIIMETTGATCGVRAVRSHWNTVLMASDASVFRTVFSRVYVSRISPEAGVCNWDVFGGTGKVVDVDNLYV